jgi:hypothetical protein
MNKKIIFFGLAGLLASLLSTSAHAVASMSFSGGVNSPVVFTLNQSVQYTITTTPTEPAPGFAFQGVADLFSASFADVSGTMTYSVNSGSPLTLNRVNSVSSGSAGGDLSASDLYFFGPNTQDPVGWLQAGDVVTLWSGQLTTTQDFTLTLPLNGEFSTFMFEDRGVTISTDGVSVSAIPEPETYALMLAGLAMVGVAAKRRRKNT